MNIFYLNNNPHVCARYHVDKHVVKMILETAQLLSTAHRVLDGKEFKLSDDRDTKLYKATHVNHPSAIWSRASAGNYKWLHALLIELCAEYTFRYNKVHKVQRDDLDLLLSHVPFNINDGEFVEPPAVVSDDCKTSDVISSYHNYYNVKKCHMFKWKNRETPAFVQS